jgi:hypothetical protein
MAFRVTTFGLLGAFAAATATAIACGGRTAALDDQLALLQGDDAAAGGSSGVGPGGSSSSGASSTSGSSGIGPGGSSSGEDLDAPSMEDVTTTCGPNAETYGYGSALSSCWPCIDKGCFMELYGCTQDCACNEAIVKALACVEPGAQNATPCFTNAFGSGDGDTTAFINCLAMTADECSCLGPPPTPDAGACVVQGGGSSGGTGECTSEFSETCGDTSYKVVCSCPQNQCVCFGDTTTVIQLDSCPYCPGLGDGPAPTESDLFAQCGFPQ